MESIAVVICRFVDTAQEERKKVSIPSIHCMCVCVFILLSYPKLLP